MRFLNVLVADSHPIFVEGLQAVLSKPGDRYSYAIRGIAKTGLQVSEMLRLYPADLLLFDLNLPETDGLKILPDIKKASNQIRILVMTAFDDPRMVKAAFRAGADGYMLKSGTKDELLRAINEVIDGHTFMGRGVALSEHALSSGSESAMPERRFARKHGLTKREIEIMRLIGQALSNKEIAEKLYISDQTASVHRKNIMRKLQVNNTANLIKIAYENNLVV
jgi:DNA-binding NarL/FixJ family response regulator